MQLKIQVETSIKGNMEHKYALTGGRNVYDHYFSSNETSDDMDFYLFCINCKQLA